ncbi:MAG: nitroreductase family protein [Gammaproteobacteria bacterium]|nr:nitroreductase family protein [Gammaproteobacteria bacterium]
MSDKIAVTAVPIHSVIARRWSPRAFDAVRAVEREQLLALLEAARWAPSCFGDQPWRFVVCDRFDDAEAWQGFQDCLADMNHLWAKNAPVLILATAVPNFTHNDEPNRWHQYDVGAASENLCLQAAALGLVAHQMGGFDVDRARATFGIPPEVDVLAAIAVGHPGALDELAEDFRDAEQQARFRAPLGERFFRGNWGNPLLTSC